MKKEMKRKKMTTWEQKNDVKRKAAFVFCFKWRIGGLGGGIQKQRKREWQNRSINEFKRRELTSVAVFPLKEHSLNEALLPLLSTNTAPPWEEQKKKRHTKTESTQER